MFTTRWTFTDSGKILFRGKEVDFIPSSEIGYLPEERGLYRKMKVKEHLVYLARVRDLSKSEALIWLFKRYVD